MWEFETDDVYQEDLNWAAEFIRDEIEPLHYVLDNPLDLKDPVRNALIRPLQERVRERGLWATHLGPELGGKGHGQVKLALLNEILGGVPLAPIILGCQAPDTGNAEILAHYGTEEHKARWLRPLLDGEVFSCFSMTEPQGAPDPTLFTTSAVLDGGQWVMNGEKWFSSNARYAAFLIVMAVTELERAQR
jgi:acyl-CoA dehydrogenase